MEAVWINGPIDRVVVTKTNDLWCVQLQNKYEAILRSRHEVSGFEYEVSYPYPGNKSKTSTEAKRLGKHHKVPVYLRDPGKAHVLIQGVK